MKTFYVNIEAFREIEADNEVEAMEILLEDLESEIMNYGLKQIFKFDIEVEEV